MVEKTHKLMFVTLAPAGPGVPRGPGKPCDPYKEKSQNDDVCDPISNI